MTRHKHTHIGLVTPSPLDRWIDATLRVLAMLVHCVLSTLQMIRRRDAVNATQPTPAVLPRVKTDTIKEHPAAPQSSYPIALMLRSAASLRVSKHEGVLTHASHKLQQQWDRFPPPSGGGAKRTARWSAKIRWGTALTHLAIGDTSRKTVPHLGVTRANTCARPSSPARGRINPAPV